MFLRFLRCPVSTSQLVPAQPWAINCANVSSCFCPQQFNSKKWRAVGSGGGSHKEGRGYRKSDLLWKTLENETVFFSLHFPLCQFLHSSQWRSVRVVSSQIPSHVLNWELLWYVWCNFTLVLSGRTSVACTWSQEQAACLTWLKQRHNKSFIIIIFYSIGLVKHTLAMACHSVIVCISTAPSLQRVNDIVLVL